MILDAYLPKAAPPLSDAYYARLFAPPGTRAVITAVLAYAAEAEDCVRHSEDAAPAQLKLAWWHEEVALLASAQPRHPVSRALAEHAGLRTASALLLALLHAAERRLDPAPYATEVDWLAHCEDAAALHELLALARGAGPDACRRGRVLGAAAVRARLVATSRRAAAAGHVQLPLDALASAGLRPADLTEPWPAAAVALLEHLGEDAGRSLDAAFAAIAPAEHGPLQACAIIATLQSARLAQLAAQHYAPTHVELHPLRRLWTAWRTARRFSTTD